MDVADLPADMMDDVDSGEVNTDPASEFLNADTNEASELIGEGNNDDASVELNSSDLARGDEEGADLEPEEGPGETDESTTEPAAKKLKVENEGDETLDGTEANESGLKKDGAEKSGTGPDTDMLSTLACAALNQDDKDDKPAKKEEITDVEKIKKRSEQWHNVGIFSTNHTVVTEYFGAVERSPQIDCSTVLQQTGRKIPLEPGTAYKIRVCALNACGAGPWSEVAAFKTTLPGFPGAPSAIKITKGAEGAHLTWEPPGGNSGEILEYAVYLAVRSASQGNQPVSTTPAQLAFVRVFCGPINKCVVGTTSLQAAHIDTSTKPAIIFRIAARNDKGYGPATQVRWLQDSAQGMNASAAVIKRSAARV